MCACLLCCAVLLLLMGSVLCVERCGGVRRARAVRVCGMWVVGGLLLLLVWASVLCVGRCAGVRRARAVRACVLESRVRLRAARALVWAG